ncbi:DMT family transporter [Alphaproteobacteria bacterium]|nr:DMT family transporter [Alphaproteobacteria bacterium]MDB9825393.1 DMT family transporter [Alphaproteobacteria bacterium]
MFKLKINTETIGIIFAILAYLSFSLLDTIQKTLIIYYSVFQLLFIKYCFTLCLSFIESRRKKNYKFYLTNNFKLQILRSFLSILESACFVLAFRYLSLADAHSIGGLTPIIVVIFSSIFLREKITPKIWLAIFMGFIGVLVIMRPGLSIFDPKSLIPLSAALFLGLYQVVTRKASEYDQNETSLFYTAITGILIMGSISFFYWIPINLSFILLFMGVGVFYSLGLYLQIIALSKARASMVQPFHYTLIFWAIIFGFIFYNDVPDLFTIIGATIIASSGIYIFVKKGD